MYVTLEPCCHHGRTPPCTRAIIEAGITEVYAAMADPDPRVAGKGFEELRSAGIEVHYPLLEDEARRLNEAYIKHRTTGMPFVILKSAMTLDGRIATRTGDSKWITNERSRAYAHRLRSRVDAILVGGATARADDPRLTARLGRKVYYPSRVVVTATGDLPLTWRRCESRASALWRALRARTSESLRKLERAGARILTLSMAGRTGVDSRSDEAARRARPSSVLIEGGGEVAASALAEGVVDKVIFFYAPKIIGGETRSPRSEAKAPRYRLIDQARPHQAPPFRGRLRGGGIRGQEWRVESGEWRAGQAVHIHRVRLLRPVRHIANGTTRSGRRIF